MRRIMPILFAVILLICLALPAAGVTQASKIAGYATIAPDESAQITLTATVHLDHAVSNLEFPLPKNAGNITLNGSRASVRTREDVQAVNLSRHIGAMAGDYSFTLNYRLTGLVEETELGLQLALPMLSGFAYPIAELEFSVTLPGTVTEKPAFSSGYHQANIEKDLTCTVSGATISGFANKALKDHETLYMTLPVTETMFPQTRFIPPSMNFCYIGIGVCAALALLYWLIFWRALPPKRQASTSAPVGLNAGLLGATLKLQGIDLPVMIFSWAQMGYLNIQVKPGGHIFLHKQMDMGNECSQTDSRLFEKLFQKRDTVDTASLRFAHLCQDCEKVAPLVNLYLKRPKTNPKIFRVLAAGIALFGGVALGITLSGGAILQWFLGIIFGGLGLVCGWHIQHWTDGFLLRNKPRLYIGLGFSAVWLLFGLIAGIFPLAAWIVFSQLLAGAMNAYGGIRTTQGRYAMSQTLGLRRYLWAPGKEDLHRICEGNPDFFHDTVPYALALGVDKAFARNFGKQSISPCPYILMDGEPPRTASQWREYMRFILSSMEARRRKLLMERLATILYNLKR